MKGPDLIFRLEMHRQFLSGPCLPPTRSCGHIAPRVIALIDRCRAGISHLQRLPASITRATIWRRQCRGFQSKGSSQIQSLAIARRT